MTMEQRQGRHYETFECLVCMTTTEMAKSEKKGFYRFCPECLLTSPAGTTQTIANQNWLALSNAIRGKSFGWGALIELYEDRKHGTE